MRVGFTGTQRGMTEAQKQTVESFLRSSGATEFHHGDCIGADAQAAYIAGEVGICTFVHPPEDQHKRARFVSGEVPTTFYDPLPYLERNHSIVDCTDVLLATPKTNKEELRSGTWATIRYAIRISLRAQSNTTKSVIIIYPDGSFVEKG